VSAKSADKSTVQFLLNSCKEESPTVYTDGFRAYDPLEDDETYQREAVIHREGEYVDENAYVNTGESHASLVRRWLSPHRGVSKDKLTPYPKAFQLRRQILRKSGRDALKEIVRSTLWFTNNILHMSDSHKKVSSRTNNGNKRR